MPGMHHSNLSRRNSFHHLPESIRTVPLSACSGLISSTAIHHGLAFVYLADGMSKPPASTPVRSATPNGLGPPGQELVCAFNELRVELVSTLYYVLGNYEDA